MWSRVSRVRLEPVYLEWNETVSVRVGPVKESRSPSAAPSRRLNCRIVERLANLRSVEATCPPDTGTLYCPLPCRNRGAAPGAHHPNKPKFSHITLAGRSSSETVVKKNFGLCPTPGDPDWGPTRPSVPVRSKLILKDSSKRTSDFVWLLGTPIGDQPGTPCRSYPSFFRSSDPRERQTEQQSWRLQSNTLGTQYSLFYTTSSPIPSWR